MQILAGAEGFTGLFLGASGMGMVLLVMGGCYYITKLIIDGVRRGHITKLEAQARENQDRLKSLMIQRGMSADEIERVLRSEGGKIDFTGEAENPEARIVEVLSDNSYEAADIERILRAARGGDDQVSPAACRLVVAMGENWAKAADIERLLQSRGKPATA